ncbi:hypothetical protein B9T24_00995 [Acinetobacter sp. ANC 4654]|uniref:hypothetical protein n=1 Tax=Acinetobacter sp. ANC 4654 TaxID=1977872 RepID=UPI000A33C37F|nr:hypothetical protein [Acinetobacter sp. ANC 4654]OTG97980.1 hypothetical protein B9T24_00995 [Acinetobacter sp. ANC 4654]
MPQNFVIRFASVLSLVLILAALVIHFLFSGETTVVLWIFTFPIILAIPILTSVLLAKDQELGVSVHK